MIAAPINRVNIPRVRENISRVWFEVVTKNCKSIGTTGAIAELVVATDLLGRGYEVFRALSPSCSGDLAVLKNGEARYRSPNWIQKLHRQDKLAKARRPSCVEQWAIVIGGNEITYEPEFD